MNFVEEEENEAHVASTAQKLQEICTRQGNLETRMGNLEELITTHLGKLVEFFEILTIPPEVRERLDREKALRAQYKPLFDAAAEGEWVVLPAPLQPFDCIKVVGVTDDDDYKDKIGIWYGPGRHCEIVGMKKRQFKKSLLRVVVKK
jgi:hypothetical protein